MFSYRKLNEISTSVRTQACLPSFKYGGQRHWRTTERAALLKFVFVELKTLASRTLPSTPIRTSNLTFPSLRIVSITSGYLGGGFEMGRCSAGLKPVLSTIAGHRSSVASV